MTDIIETHGLSAATIQTVGKRPWNAPRLIDLDEDDSEGMNAGNIMGTPDDKFLAPAEGTQNLGGITIHRGVS